MSLLIIRLLVFVLVFWAGWRLWQYWQGFQNQRVEDQQGGNGHESMVKCEQCGVHLPASEAIKSGKLHFCCIEHRDAYNTPPRDQDSQD